MAYSVEGALDQYAHLRKDMDREAHDGNSFFQPTAMQRNVYQPETTTCFGIITV